MIESVFAEAGEEFITYPFDIHGSDERQYSSQGFRINCATICKDRYYEYPEYHSSLDNLEFVTGAQIARSFEAYWQLVDKLEARRIYRNRMPCGEVMLSRHGLYPASGGAQRPEQGGRSELDLLLWLLFLCDGRKALDDIALELKVGTSVLEPLVGRLLESGLLADV
jgi:aminopeptidase-like protein